MKKISKNVKKQLLNLLFVLILLGITITVLVVNFEKELNFENIGAFFGSCNPYFIVAAFACMALFVLFEAVSLFFIARNLGHKSKFHQSIAYATADTYYSAITPSATGGQPASAFYMTRDGMGAGRSSFALVFNLIGYTAAVLILGLVALILRPEMFFAIEPFFVKFLIILGLVIQIVLLGLFIGCMFFGKAILKVGNWLIRVFTKIRIIKKPEKWQKKLEDEVGKFSSCRAEIRSHPRVIFEGLIFNVLSRLSQTLIPIFVCLSAKPDSSFIDLFVMQVLVLFGYNCVPLPGGAGAYEYLYVNIYCIHPGYDEKFIVVAMLISRFIQYYICMIISGIYTLTYHMIGGKKKKGVEAVAVAVAGEGGENATEADIQEPTERAIPEPLEPQSNLNEDTESLRDGPDASIEEESPPDDEPFSAPSTDAETVTEDTKAERPDTSSDLNNESTDATDNDPSETTEVE